MTTLRDCIRLFHEAQATRDPARPIRLVRVAMLTTRAWRGDQQMFSQKGQRPWYGGQAALTRELAETGEHLCGIEVGYGPPEYRGPEAVRAFARALEGISRPELEARLDARELNSRKIYPGHWTGDEADRGYVGAHFEALVEFVSDAAAAGQGVLLQFT